MFKGFQSFVFALEMSFKWYSSLKYFSNSNFLLFSYSIALFTAPIQVWIISIMYIGQKQINAFDFFFKKWKLRNTRRDMTKKKVENKWWRVGFS